MGNKNQLTKTANKNIGKAGNQKQIAKKAVKTVAIAGTHVAAKKVATVIADKSVAIFVKKGAETVATKYVPKVALRQIASKAPLVGPTIYVGCKAVQAGKYIHKNKDRIKKDGLIKTAKDDLKKGMKENPVLTVVDIVL